MIGAFTATLVPRHLEKSSRYGIVPFVAVALVLHVGLSLTVHPAPAVSSADKVTLVEFAEPAELPAPPPPEPPKEPEPIDEPHAMAPHAAPQAARAGALMTAKESAPSAKQDELVDFVTDPSGTSYGSGVVARGGTADHGALGATARGVGSAVTTQAEKARADGIVAAANLSRRATLTALNPCAGFYPSEATSDAGAVTLTLVVRADGAVASAVVVSETPSGEGFGKAARTCLERKRFEPSLDLAGVAVTAATTIKIRFVR